MRLLLPRGSDAFGLHAVFLWDTGASLNSVSLEQEQLSGKSRGKRDRESKQSKAAFLPKTGIS